MARIINSVWIDGPIEPIFDLVTTTRFWPQWHPATTGVSGVTERPVLVGDVVHERATIGGREYQGSWHVAEHQRPSRVVLDGESGRIQITYLFQSVGPATEFRRILEYQPEDFAASAPNPEMLEKLMSRQSDEALQKLKQLVESILHDE
jgi:hypothetical protein